MIDLRSLITWNCIIFAIVVTKLTIIFGCSSRYFDESTTEEDDLKIHYTLEYAAPWLFKYIRSPDQFVISYNNQKRSPIWGYEKLGTDAGTHSSRSVFNQDKEIDEEFRADLEGILKEHKDYTLVPIILPENHRDNRKLYKSSNYLLMKFDEDKKKLWDELNEYIRSLANNKKISDLQVCTGTLFRSTNTIKSEEEARAKNGFYPDLTSIFTSRKKPPPKNTKECESSSPDEMKYTVLNGCHASPNALFKTFTYVKDGQQKFGAFVIPETNTPGTFNKLFNYAYQVLSELERHTGFYIFEDELQRRLLSSRNSFKLNRNDIFKKLAEDLGTLTSIEQVITKVVFTDERVKYQDGGSSALKKDEESRAFAFADHTIRAFTNYMIYYNHKNLVADWVIENLDKTRANNDKGSKLFRPDPEMKVPFAVKPRCYGKPYSQGHLAPASNHQSSKKAYEETYVMTNMSPQTLPFNNGPWEKLESCVVKFFNAKGYDKAYIMTGPLYIPDPTTNIMQYDLMSEMGVAVPTHFFKVIAFEREDMSDFSPDADLFSIASFVMKHDVIDPKQKKSQDARETFDINNYVKSLQYIEKHAGFKILSKFPSMTGISHEIPVMC